MNNDNLQQNEKQDLRQVRIEKMNSLKSRGIQVYPSKYKRTHSCLEAKGLSDAVDGVSIAGRMMLYRSFGSLAFATIQDQSGRVQIAFQKNKVGDEIFKLAEKDLDLGDFIGIKGEKFTTKHGEPTILVKEFTFLGKALRPLPEKFHGLIDEDAQYRQRYLDLIMNEETMQRFKFRSSVIRAIREYYWKNGFYEVETSSLEHSATGAAAKPYLTHCNGLDIDIVLRISMEFPHKKLITGGFEKVFEIGKAFRNEGIDPTHLPEHTHFEHYVAYWSYEENMEYMENLIKHIFKELGLETKIMIKDKEGKEQEVDFGKPFERIDYVKLIEKDSGINVLETNTAEGLRKEIEKKNIKIDGFEKMGYATLIDYLYKKVSRPKIVGPAFLTNYPKEVQPFARSSDSDPRIVEQAQLLINGWEIVKLYSELVDPIEQKKRLDETQKALDKGDEEAYAQDDEYITSMEYGMPPISGMGLGLDRLITLLSGKDNLRDVVLFPLVKPNRG